MAGTLEVTNALCWMPAGWVFDHALECMAAVLQAQSPLLAELLRAARIDANGGYLDVRDWHVDQLETLRDAAHTAYDHITRTGAQRFAQPAFHEGFLQQFHQLCDMLHTTQQKRLSTR